MGGQHERRGSQRPGNADPGPYAHANITRDMAIEVIGGIGEEKDGLRLLCLREEQHERLLFAITKTADMAGELDTAFHQN